MLLKHLIPGLACVAILGGCAVDQPRTVIKQTPAPTLASSLADADLAAKAGNAEKAMTVLKAAAAAHPAEKEPWLRMAQMCYDAKVYGDAIAGALEVLERDPNDVNAHNIVAVSGLRVVNKSLTDLNKKAGFNGSVAKSEAQEMAKLLKVILKEDKPLASRPSIVKPAGDILDRF